MDPDTTQTLVDTRIVGRRANRDVVSLNAAESKELLNGDANRYTSAPYRDDDGGFKSAIDDIFRQAKRISQQLLGRELVFVSHRFGFS